MFVHLVALASAAPSALPETEVQAEDELIFLPAGLDELPIIDGEAATRDDWPMAGGVILETTLSVSGFDLPQTSTVCSSTLIAPDVVMLAAHCVDEQIYALQMVQSGLGPDALGHLNFWFSQRPDLSDYVLGANAAELPGNAVRAAEVLMHPDFSAFALQPGLSENFDIALLFLEEPILDTPLGYVPQPDTHETEIEIGEDVVIVGWGKQVATTGATPPPPGTFGIKRMGNSTVTDKRPFEIKIGEANTTHKCQGDSGGPTFKEVATDSAETWRVIGVTSHNFQNTDNCDVTTGVDTRVSRYLPWLEEEMRSRCDDGSRAWCDIPGIIPPPRPDGTVAWDVPDDDGDPIDDDGEPRKACACSNGGLSVGWLLLSPLLLLRRR